MLLLTRHPEVQARVYEEIKAVVGTDRIPDMQDRAALPYLDCVIQEFHRFNPAIPLVTHGNSKEDEYLGYRIPKKTWIMANVWCVTPNPFDPVFLVLTHGPFAFHSIWTWAGQCCTTRRIIRTLRHSNPSGSSPAKLAPSETRESWCMASVEGKFKISLSLYICMSPFGVFLRRSCVALGYAPGCTSQMRTCTSSSRGR